MGRGQLLTHVMDADRAECWHQGAMSDAPIVFTMVGGEQAIFDSIADFVERTRDGFAESLFVAEFVDELGARDTIPLPA